MKTIRIAIAALMVLIVQQADAQVKTNEYRSEKFGNTLNIGLGMVYFGYVGTTVPAVHINYEIDVARNFTLAPFLTYFAYTEYYYWGNPAHPYRDYYYKESVMPVGVKGSYYFDEILGAGPKWDFYLGASLGFAIRKTVWEDGYYGDRTVARASSNLYIDGHIGTEYHINRRAGILLDLSSGISTLSLAVHL